MAVLIGGALGSPASARISGSTPSKSVSLSTWAWVYGKQLRELAADVGEFGTVNSLKSAQSVSAQALLDATAASFTPAPANDARSWRTITSEIRTIAKQLPNAEKVRNTANLQKQLQAESVALKALRTFVQPFFNQGLTVGGFASTSDMLTFIQTPSARSTASS